MDLPEGRKSAEVYRCEGAFRALRQREHRIGRARKDAAVARSGDEMVSAED
jgi:hypothetical protein